MRIKHLQFKTITFAITMIFISCSQSDKPILNETFDENTRGWVEESTEYHNLYIDSGFYYISSLDTSAATYRTSVSSLDNSYLFSLPERYAIESKFELKKSDFNDVHFGLLLRGASLEYTFNVHKSGLVEILEYNYNSRLEHIILSDTSDYKFEDELKIKIIIDKKDFRFFIEDYEIGHSEFRVKCWQGLRLFTSKQSEVAVDYITIKELKQEESN